MFNVVNFVVYQVVWFACVLGAAHGGAGIGVAVAVVAVIGHLILVRTRRSGLRIELTIVAATALIGFVVDTVLVQTGAISFAATAGLPGGQPWWMLSLWLAFATTLRHSMAWIMRRPGLAIVLGAIGGPLAYWAGAKLGALSVEATAIAWVKIGGMWATALIILSLTIRHQHATLARTAPANRGTSLRGLLPLIMLAALAVAPDASRADASRREWYFDAFVDDRPIGHHRFTLLERGGELELLSDASFDVRFLFFNAYRYRHVARERWQGGCLAQLEATTDDDGKKFSVQADRRSSSFVVNANETRSSIDSSCVQTFAYWNPAILEAEQLLDPQTGEYRRVRIQLRGSERIDGVEVRRYRIVTVDEGLQPLQIDLWYSQAGDWLRLESQLPGGRTLRYVRR